MPPTMEDQMMEGGIGAASNPTKFTGPMLESPFLQTKQFPALSPEHEYAFKSQLVHGFPFTNAGIFKARAVEYYHKLAIATTDRKLTFFNAAAQDFVSNMKNGEVPSGRPMWAQAIGFRIVEVDNAGALLSGYSALSQANFTSLTNYISLLKTLSNSLVRLKVHREIEFEKFGVDRLPAGGGGRMDAMGFNGTATTIAVGVDANLCNIGDPTPQAILMLPSPIALLPGKSIELTVDLQAATIPAAGSLAAFVMGTEVVGANFSG